MFNVYVGKSVGRGERGREREEKKKYVAGGWWRKSEGMEGKSMLLDGE